MSRTWRKLQRVQERFWASCDARRLRRSGAAVLFVDAGSNIGQGFSWFERFYNDPKIQFHLFEPNPHCLVFLEGLKNSSRRRIEVYPVGLSVGSGTALFYGLNKREGGPLSQGGSLVRDHNSAVYTRDSEVDSIVVNTIDFYQYLLAQSPNYDRIVVKMDVEGAEIELLDHLIRVDGCKLIDTLYVEFHSKYRAENERASIVDWERQTLQKLRLEGVRVRVWH